jgi:sn-glycerol 3-phosphate transport system substrate-binding protein
MRHQKFNAIALFFWLSISSPAIAAPLEIVFWHSMAGQLGDEVNRLTQQFNDSQTDYVVKPIYKGNYIESLTSFAAAFRAKRPPNLIQVFEVGTSVMQFPEGIIKPVEQLMHEQGIELPIEQILPAVRRQYSYRGQLMAMPFNVSIPVMFYNKEALAAVGVSIDSFPKTWRELEILAKHLHQAGFSCAYATAYPAWTLIASYQALHGLSDFHAASGNRQTQAHLTRMRRWQQKHYFEYGGPGDASTVLFTSGKCPIFSQSSGALAGLSKVTSFHIGVAPMPVDSAMGVRHFNNLIGGAAIWVVASENKPMDRGVAMYLAYLSQPKVQADWYENTGYLPYYRLSEINLNQKSHSIMDIALRDLGQTNLAVNSSASGAENQIRTIHDQMLEAIFSGMLTVDEAMKRAEMRIRHALLRFRKNTHQSLNTNMSPDIAGSSGL